MRLNLIVLDKQKPNKQSNNNFGASHTRIAPHFEREPSFQLVQIYSPNFLFSLWFLKSGDGMLFVRYIIGLNSVSIFVLCCASRGNYAIKADASSSLESSPCE